MANPTVTSGLTRDDLIALVEAIQKPRKSESEVLKEQQQQLDREAMAETLKLNEKHRLHRIESCSHMRSNGSTTAVYIADLSKMYCQACAGWISPNEKPELFNRLYQLAI